MIRRSVVAGAAALTLAASGAASAAPEVVATIKPIHGLAAAVMAGVGEPRLLIDGAQSPHGLTLKPSQARDLENADVVLWIGPELETSLARAIENLADSAVVLELIEAEGVTALPYRVAVGDDHHDEAAEGHGHHDDHKDDHKDDHAESHDGHDHHDGHGDGHEHADGHESHGDEHEHADGHEHDHADGHEGHGDEHEHADGHEGHEHADSHEHGHHGHDHAGSLDGHIWLDPDNAAAMMTAIAEALAEADPDNAARYQANADAAIAELGPLSEEVDRLLASAREQSFVVFHDAYQYFEQHFGLEPAVAIAINPEIAPGAATIAAIREQVLDADVACVFSEPQFPSGLTATLTEGTVVASAELDPLGASLEAGPGFYGALLRQMAATMRTCLSPSN